MQICFRSKLMCIIPLITSAYSAPIGDFAPMKVGNQWKFDGENYWLDDVMNKGGFKVLRTLEIISEQAFGDSVLFRVTIMDSIHRKYLARPNIQERKFDTTFISDTLIGYEIQVWQNKDSALRVVFKNNVMPAYQMLNMAYRSHDYDDSLVTIENHDGNNILVVRDSSGTFPPPIQNCPYNYSKRLFFQNVGLASYESGTSSCFGPNNFTFNLTSFNNKLVTSIDTHTNRKILPFPSYKNVDRNILGRKMIKGAKR